MFNQASVGSVEGVPFTACTSGTDIIILASNFSRVQQITAESNIIGIDCSTDVGKIAASIGIKIVIYEPIPLQEQNPTGARLDYKWIKTADIESLTSISVVSFNLEGTRLISGGECLQLWCIDNGAKNDWRCIWCMKTASQISYLKYSPDGTLFCSASEHDRLVKIWYERTKLGFSFIYISHPKPIIGLEWRRTSKYTPRGAVANILITSCQDDISRIWVQTLLPDDGIVNFNQLKANQNTDHEQNGETPPVPTQRHRQKLLRRLKRMKAFSQFKKRQSLVLDYSIDELEKVDNQYYRSNNSTPTATIPSAQSAHDFHSYALYTNVLRPGLHFHVAAIMDVDHTNEIVHWINNKDIHITRSIELLLHDMLIRILRGNQSSSTNSPHSARESCSGSENDTENEPEDCNDTITAESSKKLRHKLCSKVNRQRALAASGRRDLETDGSNTASYQTNQQANLNGRASPTSLVEEFDKTLESLLKKWQTAADLLFSINKSNGNLQIWRVLYLDGEDTGIFRQVQIEKLTLLEGALSHYDATTMSLNVMAYSPSAYLDVKRAFLALTNSSGLNMPNPEQFTPVDVPEILSINTETSSNTKQGSNLEIEDFVSATSLTELEPNIFLVTQHLSGILGLWKLNFDSAYPEVRSIDLVTRITGLPIDPSWLQDGILVVEYDDKQSAVITEWISDHQSSSANNNHSRNQNSLIIGDNQLFSDLNDASQRKSSSHLPSVDEDELLPDSILKKGLNFPFDQNSRKDFFRASEMAANLKLLPQYHLKQLIELLAFGKLQRVKAILNNLVNCLLSLESSQDRVSDLRSHTPWIHRSRTLSIVGPSVSSFHDSFDIDNPSSNIQQQVIEEVELDYIEVISIKPLPLHLLIETDCEKKKTGVSVQTVKREDFGMQDYESFIPTRSQVDETLDEILGQSALDTLNRQKSLNKRKRAELDCSLTSFTPSKAKLLTRVLTHTHLPGLTNIDQMHLLAVADAVAMFDASATDHSDIQDEDETQNGLSGVPTSIAIDSLDDRGLRFLTAMRQHVYLTRCLPIKQRAELQASGIGNHNLVWAFHSESQDELVSMIPCVARNRPEWNELREYGIGWWLKKIEVLRKLIEKVAQSAYQARQDPLDAALFYLAMRKKTLVCALLRRVNCDKRLLKLFEQDFSDPLNRKKALKNAYALLGLHRFEHAAAFFILAGSIWDAVEVCINNLNDIQLAIVLIRLHDCESNMPSNLKRLLFTEILGSKRPPSDSSSSQTNGSQTGSGATTINQDHGTLSDPTTMSLANASRNPIERKASIVQFQYQYDTKRAHQDPFLRSMAFWKLSDYLSSVHTLLENDVGTQHRTSSLSSSNATSPTGNSSQAPGSSANSRRDSESLSSQAQTTIAYANTADPNASTNVLGHLSPPRLGSCNGNLSISASVFNFYLFLKEQPLVVKHKQQLQEEMELRRRTSPIEEEEVHSHRARSLSSGEVSFASDEPGPYGKPIRQSSTEFEVLNDTTGRQVDKYSDEAIMKKERVLFFYTAYSYLRAGCPILALEVLCKEDHLNISNAQRMKFVACLNIIMNELNTVTGINKPAECSKKSLTNDEYNEDVKHKKQFHDWLHNNIKAMQSVCSYEGTSFFSDRKKESSTNDIDSNRQYNNQEEEEAKEKEQEEEEQHQHQQQQVSSTEQLDSTISNCGPDNPDWIRANEPVLRSMLTYCNLHSGNENSLTTVRLELLALLDSVQSTA